MSPASRCGSRSAIVWSTTPAGTMSQTALGFASFFTNSWSDDAPAAFSLTRSFTACGDRSNTTQSCPFLISRRTMLAPILPSPTIPSCIYSPLLKIADPFDSARYLSYRVDLPRALSIEQRQARTDDLFYSIDDRRENLVRHDFVGIPCQAVSQRSPPGDPEFGIDVDDVDSRGDCFAKVSIICPRPAVEGKKDPGCLLDSCDSVNVQALFRFSFHHALNHAVHVANRWSE